MPWNNKELMTLRKEFVAEVLKKAKSISQLCRDYKISRPTAYKWLKRYSEDGLIGLSDRSSRPYCMPSKVEDIFVELILSERDKHPEWGAKKLRQRLIKTGHKDLPSIASFNRILVRQDKINPIESVKRQQFIRFEREEPNELWQMDFKGHFSVIEGECHPLTILDDCSRYSICLKACASENEGSVRRALEEAFHQYGLPEAMTMDNGSPWKGYPSQRLSNLTVWLMRLGIKVGHSRPNHPQTQGKAERFHRTFKAEVLKFHNFQDLLDAQKHFDDWREIYNYERPHEALAMQCPGERYEYSKRAYVEKLEPIEYLEKDEVKKVGSNGEIFFRGKRCYIGRHLRDEFVAVRYRKEGAWDIYYVNSRIGGFSEKV